MYFLFILLKIGGDTEILSLLVSALFSHYQPFPSVPAPTREGRRERQVKRKSLELTRGSNLGMQATHSDCCAVLGPAAFFIPCSHRQNINVKKRMKAVIYQRERPKVSKRCPGKMVAKANKL